MVTHDPQAADYASRPPSIGQGRARAEERGPLREVPAARLGGTAAKADATMLTCFSIANAFLLFGTLQGINVGIDNVLKLTSVRTWSCKAG